MRRDDEFWKVQHRNELLGKEQHRKEQHRQSRKELFRMVLTCAVVVAGVGLTVFQCTHSVERGVVVSKSIEMGSIGSMGSIATSDTYVLCLRDDSVRKPLKDQPQGCVNVGASDYYRYREGDHYP